MRDASLQLAGAPQTAAEILASAALWQPDDEKCQLELERRHELALAACNQRHSSGSTSVLRHGGWCLSEPIASRPTSNRHSGGRVDLPGNHSYVLPQGHYIADAGVVTVLAEMLQANRQSINDMGAGVGEYGHALQAIDSRLVWRGYDGAGNVESYTRGFVRFVDLTTPLALPRADWVLSLEVGEHIPREHEGTYLRNLHAHNCRGIVGSWAGPGQLGTGHANLRNRSYVLQRIAELGYREDPGFAQRVAASHRPGWSQIRRNLYMMVREQPSC